MKREDSRTFVHNFSEDSTNFERSERRERSIQQTRFVFDIFRNFY